MADGAGLLLTYYGDDFTGSTDVLEALTLAGLETVLFMAPPGPEALARYPGLDAVGVAGTSRSQPPAWMDRHLPPIFEALRALGAPICHYKTCSTFDSAPHLGSIGRAIEIGQDVFATACVPVVVGVPALRRWVFFGTLFAGSGDEVYRIDRHPVMRCHPTTPMAEADLTRHLARQTDRDIALLAAPDLLADDAAARHARVRDTARIAVLDTHDAATSEATGRVLAQQAAAEPVFVAGSSGVEYALVDHLRAAGRLAPAPAPAEAGEAGRLVVASGSASVVTGRQIRRAEGNGYASVALDGARLVEATGAEIARATAAAREALAGGRNLVIHTALGPEDPRIPESRAALECRGAAASDSAALFGRALGRVLRDALAEAPDARVVLAGGDSSGYAAEALGIEALEMIAPLVPGSPLCRARSGEPALDGLEIVMKGGQVGAADYFETVRRGRA